MHNPEYYIQSCTIWASTQENPSSGIANYKGADQPVHPHSLISAFIIFSA